jgi:hypothetical protein
VHSLVTETDSRLLAFFVLQSPFPSQYCIFAEHALPVPACAASIMIIILGWSYVPVFIVMRIAPKGPVSSILVAHDPVHGTKSANNVEARHSACAQQLMSVL